MQDAMAALTAEEAYNDAAEAIRREYRESVRPRRLRCLDVADAGEGIFRLSVGRSVELDISWEGSNAFRPRDLENYTGGFLPEQDLLWIGEVVEVDEVNGHIYIVGLSLDFDRESARGTFFIREFPFLGPLRAIYLNSGLEQVRKSGLDDWLLRSCGTTAPVALNGSAHEGAPALDGITRYMLSYLWGPPGTGKTYTIGEHVANLIRQSTEKVLVVSTTNKATDEVALSIGRALLRLGDNKALEQVVRVGKGALLSRYKEAGLQILLEGSESLARIELAKLTEELRAAVQPEERASIRARMSACRLQIKNSSVEAVLHPHRRAVVTTSFNALQMISSGELSEAIAGRRHLISTLIVDEAGLISRAAMSALSLHSGGRVLLAGDPKQLAPISRIARVLPPDRARWLAKSALSHLTTRVDSPESTMLERQYRMHPEIREAVSEFQYGGRLRDAEEVANRPAPVISLLQSARRAVWYVLDEEQDDLAKIRAERGPGNRSWIREATIDTLTRLFSAGPELKSWEGLFLSPFVAQAKKVDDWLKQNGFGSWRASTIHAQQGAEADVVVFDTVNAGSHVWPVDEWRRLVNVGLSRAREFVLLISSRDEMREPYLRELKEHLSPRVLKWRGSRYQWQSVEVEQKYPIPPEIIGDPERLGAQLESRKSMRPLLSREQERLCRLDLDGKPRLVRGVAGSGKTVILANWLARTALQLRDEQSARVWIVYANKSLRSLIDSTAQLAWDDLGNGDAFPWDRVDFWHIQDLLKHLYEKEGLGRASFGFDYEVRAKEILDRVQNIEPLCRGLFVDEAQDLGDSTLHLLANLVEKSNPDDENSKSFVVFYDNAQNVYGRSTPNWSDFGLDMRGRSTVLKESFRSTQPVSEFALNVLYRLQPPTADSDHRELVRRNLIEQVERPEGVWWKVHFNQIHGPLPRVRVYGDLESEITAIAQRTRELIADEGVRPIDIRILYMGKNIPYRLEQALPIALAGLGVKVEQQTSRAFSEDENVLVITTPHSFKGYDSEVVIVAAADQFRSKEAGINASGLYVALTRARSILEVYAKESVNVAARTIIEALQGCDEDLSSSDVGDPRRVNHADLASILSLIGEDHADWLESISKSHEISLEPVVSSRGELLAHPAFHYESEGQRHACIVSNARPRERSRLEDAGFIVFGPGDLAVE